MNRPRRERGVALFVALVMLVLMTALALTGFRLSMGSMRNAVGEELRVDAFQNAQSLIDMTLAVPGNTAVTGPVDRANCLPGVTDADCYANTVSTPVGMGGAGISVKVRRLAPEYSPPPRGTGYSAVKFTAAQMQIESSYDATAYGWGRDQLQEGVAVVVPANE